MYRDVGVSSLEYRYCKIKIIYMRAMQVFPSPLLSLTLSPSSTFSIVSSFPVNVLCLCRRWKELVALLSFLRKQVCSPFEYFPITSVSYLPMYICRSCLDCCFYCSLLWPGSGALLFRCQSNWCCLRCSTCLIYGPDFRSHRWTDRDLNATPVHWYDW